jgi:hypothetical protein
VIRSNVEKQISRNCAPENENRGAPFLPDKLRVMVSSLL